MHRYLPFIATIGLSFLCVGADYLLKRASAFPQPYKSPWFIVAVFIEASTAFGWIYVMQHIKLATLGAFYSVSIVLLLALLGVTVFNESLSSREYLGIGFAILSLVLLGRFN
ncbi:MAG: transporter [Verrucomicrobiota bacterium]